MLEKQVAPASLEMLAEAEHLREGGVCKSFGSVRMGQPETDGLPGGPLTPVRPESWEPSI